MSGEGVIAVELAGRAVEAARSAGIADASSKRLDAFTGREGVCIRPYSTRVVEEYMDGSATRAVTLQIVARRRSAMEAMGCCDAAVRAVAADGLGGDDEPRVTAEPYELKIDEEQYHAWAARVEIEITEEGF